MAGLLAALGVLLLAAHVVGTDWAPPTLLAVPVVYAGLTLRLRAVYAILAGAVLVAVLELATLGKESFRPGNVLVVAAAGVLAVALARSREGLGLSGLQGEGMLLELRDRLRKQGELPALPAGWRAEIVQTSAGGAGFGGDFMVSWTDGAGRLELALVDVSGKGLEAGTRALQLSGALGGLLGAVPPERFLAAANDYLLRQDWDEGFATAVHVAVDLRTGEYLLESAGHPPAAQFKAGSGKWELSEASGGVLGFFPAAAWRGERGRLMRGDALLLYTDGLIEIPGRDLGLGVDALLGEANRLVVTTFEGGAARLLDAVGPQALDDRALLILWRT